MRYTLDSLIEETVGALNGHTVTTEQVTWLTSEANETTTTLSVADSGQVRRGIAEVGDELVYVHTSTDNTLTLAPFGRGYQATVARSWPTNTRVTFSPRFPRHHIRSAINDVIEGTWPLLFGVDSVEITPGGVRTTFELPPEAEQVLTVKQPILGASNFERTIRRFGINKDGQVPTLDIFEPLDPGRPVRVTYMTRPRAAESEFSESGLRDRAWPAIKAGVLFHMIGPQEAGEAGLHSVKASENMRHFQKSPVDLSRQFYQQYSQLVLDERTRLLQETEITQNQEPF